MKGAVAWFSFVPEKRMSAQAIAARNYYNVHMGVL